MPDTILKQRAYAVAVRALRLLRFRFGKENPLVSAVKFKAMLELLEVPFPDPKQEWHHADTCGPDSLEEIFEAGSGDGPGTTTVVRWCSKCGAVVIDTDYDGRTKPGAIMPMRHPTEV